MEITFLFNMGEGWSIFKCMWWGEGGGGLESIQLLTSFIQQMHEMKQGRIQDFSYVSQNFRSELDI